MPHISILKYYHTIPHIIKYQDCIIKHYHTSPGDFRRATPARGKLEVARPALESQGYRPSAATRPPLKVQGRPGYRVTVRGPPGLRWIRVGGGVGRGWGKKRREFEGSAWVLCLSVSVFPSLSISFSLFHPCV